MFSLIKTQALLRSHIFFGDNFTLYWTRTIETNSKKKKETKTNDFLHCNNDLEKDIIILKLLSMEMIKNIMNLVILKRGIFSFYSISDDNYNHILKYYKCIITLFSYIFFLYVLCPFRKGLVMAFQNLIFLFVGLRNVVQQNDAEKTME